MRPPDLLNSHAAWNPSTALWVAQMRSRGTKPSTIVQADMQAPSMTMDSPEFANLAELSRVVFHLAAIVPADENGRGGRRDCQHP